MPDAATPTTGKAPEPAATVVARLLAEPLVARLRRLSRGQSVQLVGGALRDRMLGRESPDLDLVVGGRGESFSRHLAEALGGRLVDLGGERFAAFRIVGVGTAGAEVVGAGRGEGIADATVLDVWGREDAPLEAELARRDLTVNSMAVDLATGRLMDPFGGAADLARRLLRATTDASFSEDPLRILRLVRFAVTLPGFTIEPETRSLAIRSAPRLPEVAVERLRQELDAIFGPIGDTSRPAGAARLFEALGVYPLLWQDAPAPDAEAAATSPRQDLAELPAWIAELADAAPAGPFDAVDAHNAKVSGLDQSIVCHAVLYSHAAAPGGTAGAGRLLTRRNRPAVERLLRLEPLPRSEADGRWFLHLCGERWPEALAFAGVCPPARAGKADQRARALRLAALAARDGAAIFSPPRLLDGHEVQERLGVPSGPLVGEALQALGKAQVMGRVQRREEAETFIEKFRKVLDFPGTSL